MPTMPIRARAIPLLAATLAATSQPASLRRPEAKDVAMRLVSAAENSSLDWRAQYRFIAYNVEHDAAENRGYTAGIIGFTSRTGDMLALVKGYDKDHPGTALSPFLPALRRANGTSSRRGLGKPFEHAWAAAARDPAFQSAQDRLRDQLYFDPAVDRAIADGLQALGQFAYYDAMVMHGPGDDPTSFGGIRAMAMRHAKRPADGGDEAAYLDAFLDARVAAMKAERGHQDTSRVDAMQRTFLRAGNLQLQLPLVSKTYGDSYRIDPQ